MYEGALKERVAGPAIVSLSSPRCSPSDPSLYVSLSYLHAASFSSSVPIFSVPSLIDGMLYGVVMVCCTVLSIHCLAILHLYNGPSATAGSL